MVNVREYLRITNGFPSLVRAHIRKDRRRRFGPPIKIRRAR